MRGLLAVLAVLTGCDRVFGLHGVQDAAIPPPEDMPGDPDAPPRDAPASCLVNGPHNEDLDTFPDACDNCPDEPNTGIDTDGDGVGDECDPVPDALGDKVYQFWTCQDEVGLTVTSQVAPLGDELRVPQAQAVTAPIPPNMTAVRFVVQLAPNTGDSVRLDVGSAGVTFTVKPCAGETAPACLHATDGTDTPVDATDIRAIGVLGNKWYVATGTMGYAHAQSTPAAGSATLTSLVHNTSITSIIVYMR